MKYVFVWSVKYANALTIDIFLRGYYAKLPVLITVCDDRSDWYFAEDAFMELADEGYLLCMDDAFLPDFKKKASAAVQQVQGLCVQKDAVLKFNKEQFLEFFGRFVEKFAYFVGLYTRTEFFFFGKIEALLSDWAKRSYPKRHHEIVAEFLSGKQMHTIPSDVQRLVSFIIEMQHLKWNMRVAMNAMFFGDCLFDALIQRFAELTGRQDFRFLTIDEVQCVLSGKSVPRMDERVKSLAVFKENDRWQFVTGENANKMVKKFKTPVATITEIRGTTASPGKVKGIARVYEAGLIPVFENMKKGDILVTSTAGPEFMIGIQIAGAIVTEEGGLLSHAAVVSRELKIPCIVGTKIATKVLKDGDLVEVDAEKGIVRKIK